MAIEKGQPGGVGRATAGTRRVFAQDMTFPTDPAAIARMKRGDRVPDELCGWVSVDAGTAVDTAEIDPWIVLSLERNMAFLPTGAGDASAPPAVLKPATVKRAPVEVGNDG